MTKILSQYCFNIHRVPSITPGILLIIVKYQNGRSVTLPPPPSVESLIDRTVSLMLCYGPKLSISLLSQSSNGVCCHFVVALAINQELLLEKHLSHFACFQKVMKHSIVKQSPNEEY